MGFIDRFSEDVDLTIDHQAISITAGHEPESASSQRERQRRITAIKDACRNKVQLKIATALRDWLGSVLGKDD